MSLLRFMIDLAVEQPLPPGLQGQLNAIKQQIRNFQSFSSRINEGQPNEEDTTLAKQHICHHDTGESCEPEEDI